jgi:phage-related protein (TIGR01555 family)
MVYREPGERADGWENNLTGQGLQSRDKTVAGVFAATPFLNDVELTNLFNSNDLAHTIVAEPVDEMLRRGWSSDAGDEVEARYNALGGDDALSEALTWARLYGGGAVFLGVPTGNPETPLPEDYTGEIDFLQVLDKRFLTPQDYGRDGKPVLYMLTPPGFALTTPRYVHASRLVRFDGERCDAMTLALRRGWHLSALQRVYDVLRKHDVSWDSAAAVMSDFAQGVFKIQNVLSAMSSNNGEKFLQRMQLADMTRSAMRAIVIDANGEDFERVATPMTGLADTLDRFMVRLAAAAQMPVTKLFGRSPAGMNATGESDMRNWYDVVANKRKKTLQPAHERLLSILAGKPVKVEYPPMWEPTDQEKAQTAKTWADADNVWFNIGAVTEEEIALSRFDEEGCIRPGMAAVDLKARKTAMEARPYDVQAEERGTMAEAAVEAAKNPPDPKGAPGETEA